LRKLSAISYQLSQTNTPAKNFSVDVSVLTLEAQPLITYVQLKTIHCSLT